MDTVQRMKENLYPVFATSVRLVSDILKTKHVLQLATGKINAWIHSMLSSRYSLRFPRKMGLKSAR